MNYLNYHDRPMRENFGSRNVFIRALGPLCLCLLILAGCKEEKGTSLYDPGIFDKPAPVIDTIISATPTAYAGVTMLTLKGQNFSAKNDENRVFFGATLVNVLTSSATQLTMLTPLFSKDTLVSVKVNVAGAQLFSNAKLFKVTLAVRDFDSLWIGESPWGTAVDAAGNFYVSIVSNGTGIGVKKFALDGRRSDYAPRKFETKYSSLRFSPGGVLYGVWNIQALVQFPGGNADPVLWIALTAGTSIYDFDFDAQGNIWAGGNNAYVYRIKPDKSVQSFPLSAAIRSVRINSSYVYFAGETYPDSLEKIIRCKIVSSDSLGPPELIYNFSASNLNPGGKSVYSMAFTSQGDLFVGTDRSESMIVIHPNGTAEEFYTGLLPPTLHILVWGKGTELLGVRGTASAGGVNTSSKIVRINTQVTGAP